MALEHDRHSYLSQGCPRDLPPLDDFFWLDRARVFEQIFFDQIQGSAMGRCFLRFGASYVFGHPQVSAHSLRLVITTGKTLFYDTRDEGSDFDSVL